MKNIILSVIVLFIAILLADMEILNTLFFKVGLSFLTNTNYTLPLFFFLIILVVKNIYDTAQYTDETIPLKLSILALIMAAVGYIVFYRILLLGTLILIAASYWSHGTVMSYFPKHMRERF